MRGGYQRLELSCLLLFPGVAPVGQTNTLLLLQSTLNFFFGLWAGEKMCTTLEPWWQPAGTRPPAFPEGLQASSSVAGFLLVKHHLLLLPQERCWLFSHRLMGSGDRKDLPVRFLASHCLIIAADCECLVHLLQRWGSRHCPGEPVP